jgi:hypothetical protein
MSSHKIPLLALLTILVVAVMIQITNALDADPSGVRLITNGSSTTFNGSVYSPATALAEAGNITQLTIDAVGPTRSWTGFYGEISGEIVLEDANGNRMYNWSDTSITGELYASRASSINWSNASCFVDGGSVNYTGENSFYDMNYFDADNINSTFTQTDHDEFFIADRSVTGCPTIYTHVSDEAQNEEFVEVLLHDETTANAAIYVALIENKDNGNNTAVVGFDGSTHDFQMIVPENGTASNSVTTTYYFWISVA